MKIFKISKNASVLKWNGKIKLQEIVYLELI